MRVWTEGLGEFYGIAREERERRERDPMSLDEVVDLILRILAENEPSEVEGLFVLEHGQKQANLRFLGGQLELSNPREVNYQNVMVAIDDLRAALADFFDLHEAPEPVRRSHLILLEWVIAVVVGCGMVAAFVMVADFLEKRDTFIPEPDHLGYASAQETKSAMTRLSGIYVTELASGQTLLEISPEGRWGFYDLTGGTGSFIDAMMVESGEFRLVHTEGGLALLADSNYLFQVNSRDTLVFQDRRYLQTGKLRDDVPFLRFRL